MKKYKYLQLILIVLISGLIGYYIGVSRVSYEWKNFRPKVTVINREPPASLSTVDFSLFWTVWQKLEDSYYDKTALDGQKFVNGAISGMVGSIGDPYTVFLPPVQNTDFKQTMAGQFHGIGAELGMKDKQIIVVAPLDGSPAEKAGVKGGDIIFKVDGKSIEGWNINQAVEKIKGPKGTPVVISVLHKDDNKLTDIKIVRDVITVKSVVMWVKKVKDIDKIDLKKYADQEVAYFRLSQFGDNTNQEWLGLANKLALKLNEDKKVKGMILDLRNNPGGYLTDATFIAAEFIKEGNTVVIQDKGNGERTEFTASRKGLLLDIPLVILINKGSASASEIVAGAMRDYKRAKLIGDVSFGKGTIQTAEDLGNKGAGLHVTIAKWITPKETWVHGKGLTPDITVALDPKDPTRDTQLEKAVEELVK
ncbi:S41 family peptidase [Candidatus Microgenomates bacterium]|nr:MAG: S41 family peptidase [Candidatus Microgenomates bacterium]